MVVMPDDKRYNSGTPLERTKKEQLIDDIQNAVRVEYDDEVFIDLKSLKVGTLRELLQSILALPVDRFRHSN